MCLFYRGVLHMGNSSYGIEPLESSANQHLWYRLEDVRSKPLVCGTPHTEHAHNEEHAHFDTHRETVSHHLRVSNPLHTHTQTDE